MSKQSGREQLIAEVAVAAADFGAAAGAVDEAVAAALRVNATDLRILGAVHEAGTLTAGDAAAAASLSPAATTSAIQRLVSAGLLHRRPDPADRRRATLTLTSHAADAIHDSYGPIAEQGKVELDHWSDPELITIKRFLENGIRFQYRHAERIHQNHEQPRGVREAGWDRANEAE